ncbi:MAG: phosphate ABC transporter substrate-binding protein PstS [Aquiluna sp.]|nr:phosphate ABC transporter substrate-binding protein PstS [Aquiluna sp.]MCF8545444.1 phosphate ABC transporter substrate-binding protein PstS [Aquiluna sp.]
MRKITQIAALAGVSALVLSGCAANEAAVEETTSAATETSTAVVLEGTLDGSGASSMASGQEAWVAGFQELNPGVTVNYNPTGSGTGRDQFEEGLTFFTGSDSSFKDEELATPHPNCSPADGDVFEFPIWISPIAVMFNLEGIDTLNMSPDTVAGIFTGKITKWNDAAIAADNAGVALPDLAITAVHRSDESGTTGNFTDWLSKAAPNTWVLNGENAGDLEAWPAEFGGEGGNATSGVIAAIAAGNGTIGYADASRVGDFGTVAIGVGSEFVAYSSEAAAKIVDVSPIKEGRPATTLAYDLDRDTTESGVYPVVLISYLQGCMDYADDAKAELVKAYASYMLSAEGQEWASQNAGNAPISEDLRQKALAIIDQVK